VGTALRQPSEGGRSSNLTLPGLQPHLTTMVQASSSAISSASTLNYAVVSDYKVLAQKIIASIWF